MKSLIMSCMIFLTLYMANTADIYGQSGTTGNVYYVDNTIPDLHVASAIPDCTTYNPTTFQCGSGTASAYATIADIIMIHLLPGDQILFRRGDIWREQFTIRYGYESGASGNPITISSYGDSSSPLPIISGTNIITNWQSESVGSSVIYYASYTTIPGCSDNQCPLYADPPKQVFEDNTRLVLNTNGLSSLVPGQWFLDAADSLIYIRLVNDDNPNIHTIEASQRDFGIDIYIESYITISNIQTEYTNYAGINLGNAPNNYIVIDSVISNDNYTFGIAMGFSSNVTINSSTIYNNGGGGIIFNSVSDLLIENNSIHDNGQLSSVEYAAGILGGDERSNNVTVQYNLIYNNGVIGQPAVVRGIDFDTVGSGIVIRYNKIYGNTWDGIELDADSDVSVYGNVIYNNNYFGIRAFADWQTSMSNMRIYNNTVSNNKGGGILLLGPTPTPLPAGCINNSVINNIVVNTTNGPNLQAQHGCNNDGTYGSGNVYMYNSFGPESHNFIWWDTKSTYLFSTYAAWETATGNCGTIGCSSSVESDPQFINSSAEYLALQPTSPDIGTGYNLGQTYDNDLNPLSTWPNGVLLQSQSNSERGWNIGAYGIGKSIQTLTTVSVNGAELTGSNESITLDLSKQQSLTLSAVVTPSSGTTTVSSGTVTFTIANGSVVVGSPIVSNIDSYGAASVLYPIPSGSTAGAYTITAAYNDPSGYYASSTSTIQLTIIAAQPTFTFTSAVSSLNINTGTSSTVNLIVTPYNGLSGSVSFSCSGMPTGITCSFSPNTLTFTSSTNLAQQTTLTVSASHSTAYLQNNVPRTTRFPVTSLAVTLCLLSLTKRRRLHLLVMLVVCLAVTGFLTGCSMSSINTTPSSTNTSTPETGTITVNATSGSSQESITLSITVQGS